MPALFAQQPERGRQFVVFPATVACDTAAILEHIRQGQVLALSDPDSAVRLYSSTLQQSEQAVFAAGMRKSLQELLPLLNDAERSRLLAQTAYICSRTVRLYPVLAVVYNAMAKIFQLQGAYELAGTYYMKAIPIARQYFPDYLATLYNNYASLLLFFPSAKTADNRQGMYYLDEAGKIAARYNDLRTITCVWCNKAKIYRDQGRYAESLAASRKGLAVAREHHFLQWEYVLLNNIGDLYYNMHQPGLAIPYLQEAVQMNSRHIDPYYRNMAVMTLGEVYYALGDDKKAAFYWNKTLQVAAHFGIGRDLIEANKKLAMLYARQGDYKKAFMHQQASAQMNDSLLSRDVIENMQHLEVKYRTSEKDRMLLGNKLHMEHQARLLHRKNMFILAAVAAALILALIFIIVYSRSRQKRRWLLQDERIREMNALMKGAEKERMRLAQELHDGIGGMLAAANMHMSVACNNDFRNKEELQTVMQMIEETTEEVRKTSHNLMPAALLRENLKEALRHYCDYVHKDGALCIDLNIHGPLDELPSTYIIVIFRIVQELIQNIIRHARATHAIVSLEQTGRHISLMVEDNGAGFDVHKTPAGFGLENLRYRIRTLGGHLKVTSEPGTGTCVLVDMETGSP